MDTSKIATIVAVGGVVVIGLGLIVLAGIKDGTVDVELMKQLVTGLIGFASGAGVTYAVTSKE